MTSEDAPPFSAHTLHIVLSPRTKHGSEWKVGAPTQPHVQKWSSPALDEICVWLRSPLVSQTQSQLFRDRLALCPAPCPSPYQVQHMAVLNWALYLLGTGNDQAGERNVAQDAVNYYKH